MPSMGDIMRASMNKLPKKMADDASKSKQKKKGNETKKRGGDDENQSEFSGKRKKAEKL